MSSKILLKTIKEYQKSIEENAQIKLARNAANIKKALKKMLKLNWHEMQRHEGRSRIWPWIGKLSAGLTIHFLKWSAVS